MYLYCDPEGFLYKLLCGFSLWLEGVLWTETAATAGPNENWLFSSPVGSKASFVNIMKSRKWFGIAEVFLSFFMAQYFSQLINWSFSLMLS